MKFYIEKLQTCWSIAIITLRTNTNWPYKILLRSEQFCWSKNCIHPINNRTDWRSLQPIIMKYPTIQTFRNNYSQYLYSKSIKKNPRKMNQRAPKLYWKIKTKVKKETFFFVYRTKIIETNATNVLEKTTRKSLQSIRCSLIMF